MSPESMQLMRRAGRALDTTEVVRREFDRTLAAIEAAHAERERIKRDPFAERPRRDRWR